MLKFCEKKTEEKLLIMKSEQKFSFAETLYQDSNFEMIKKILLLLVFCIAITWITKLLGPRIHRTIWEIPKENFCLAMVGFWSYRPFCCNFWIHRWVKVTLTDNLQFTLVPLTPLFSLKVFNSGNDFRTPL